MRYAPHQLDDLDFAITVALSLLDEQDRPQRPEVLTTLAHASHWTRQVVVDATQIAAEVAAADTPADFDKALAIALERIARANAIQVAVGMNFGTGLTSMIDQRRTTALVAEAADLAEQLRPLVDEAFAELVDAAAELPAGADALDADAVLAAGAGDPWQRAHAELARLLIVAGICPTPTIGDTAGRLRSDLRHLSSIISMIDIDNAGTRVHDITGEDRTKNVDPARFARLAEVRRFLEESTDLAPTGILLSVAQGRWPAVKLAYEPTGKVALVVLANVNKSSMVTREEAHTYRAGIRKVAVR